MLLDRNKGRLAHNLAALVIYEAILELVEMYSSMLSFFASMLSYIGKYFGPLQAAHCYSDKA